MTIEEQYDAARKHYKIEFIKAIIHSYGDTYHIMDRKTNEFLHGCSSKEEVVAYYNEYAVPYITEKYLLGVKDD